MPFSTVLFDLDGTLTDPAAGIGNSLAYAVEALGRPPLQPEQVRRFIGPPLQDGLAALGLRGAELVAAVGLYREYFAQRGALENEPYPGVDGMLAKLRSSGLRLAVATSKPTVFAVRVLQHFGLDGFFDVVSGAELDGSRRHKADIIRHALTGLGRPPGPDVVMVGDREHDVIGARQCGLECIGVAWGHAAPGELAAAGATWIASDMTELLDLVTA